MNGQLRNEFNRVREDSSREYLTLDEVVQFKLPVSITCDLNHVAIIYMMDTNKDGKITLSVRASKIPSPPPLLHPLPPSL